MSGTALAPPRPASPPGPPPAPPGVGGLAGLDRVRLLVGTAMGTVLVSYGLLVPVAALVVLTTGASTSADALFGASVPLWLAAHQVPLVLDGVPLTALPLLPTLGVLALVAAAARFAARGLAGSLPASSSQDRDLGSETFAQRTSGSTDRDHGGGADGWRDAAGPVIATLAGTHAAVAVLASALLQAAGPVTAAAPWAAALAAGLTAGLAATFGVLRALGAAPSWRVAPQWLRSGLWAGRVGLAGLASCGAVLLTVALLISATDVHELVTRVGGQAGAGIGLTLLSLAYLPNAVLAASSWALGPGVQIGAALTSPFGTAGGPLPPVPLLAAVPTTAPPAWAPVVLLLPVLTGLLVGLCCRTAGESPLARLRAVGVAAAGVAAVCGLLALLAGGRLAQGPFDPVQLPALVVAGAALLLIGLPAAAVAVPDAPPDRQRTRTRLRLPAGLERLRRPRRSRRLG